MAIFSYGMKIFKNAFQHVVDNSCMIPVTHFPATNFSYMTLFLEGIYTANTNFMIRIKKTSELLSFIYKAFMNSKGNEINADITENYVDWINGTLT